MATQLNKQAADYQCAQTEVHQQEEGVSSELLMLLQKQKSQDVTLAATVLSCKAQVKQPIQDEFLVEEIQTRQVFKVKLAGSCLQVPRLGDIVHIQIFPDRTAYIMAILESSAAETEVAIFKLPDNATLQAKNLKFNTDEMALAANKMYLKSRALSINSLAYEQKSLTINYEATQFNQTVESYNLAAEKSTTRVIDAEKMVAGTDKVQAMNINYAAEALTKVSGNVTMLFGRELLKSDGKLMVVG